jgi:hypothetical protein
MLMLELMYFPEELIDVAEFNAPVKNAVGKAEMQMAKQLIERMTSEWKPEQYTDLYHEVLELVDIDGRLAGINTAILSRTGGNQGIGFVGAREPGPLYYGTSYFRWKGHPRLPWCEDSDPDAGVSHAIKTLRTDRCAN